MKISLPQQDIYFDQLMHPNEPIYNIGAKIEIKGPIVLDTFKKAFVELINQHDSYRSVFTKKEQEVWVEFLENHDSELHFVDFSAATDPDHEALAYMQVQFLKPFDLLKQDLLFNFTLVKVSPNFHYLFSVYHHIITDGWSASLMFQRLVKNYNEIHEFDSVQTDYPFSYKKFIENDVTYFDSSDYSADKNYWKERFNVLPESIFIKKTEDLKLINKSDRKELIIKRDIYNQIALLAAQHNCSSFHLILGVLYIYFARKHNNNDLAIGLPVLNRSNALFKKTVGLFMGVSPLRLKLDFETSLVDFLKEIKAQLKTDYRYQRFPLGKLVQELKLFTEKERLFNITLSYEKQDYSNNFAETQTRVIPLTHQSERAALAIYVREFDETEDVKIDFDYNLSYFDAAEIANVTRHFSQLMQDILQNPGKKIKELQYLPAEELLVLSDFNSVDFAYDDSKTFLDLFKEQVHNNPDHAAVKDDFKTYSYQEAEFLSNQIAEYLIETYGPDDKTPIAVLLERTADIVITFLAILKAGRAYIPLDPTFPDERLKFIIANSEVNTLIRNENLTLEDLEITDVIILEKLFYLSKGFKGEFLSKTKATDTAYIIYTSGSTGNPKGVEIGHRSLLNFLISMRDQPGMGKNDLLFGVTTYSFDISILEFFLPLISGASLYIAGFEVLSDPYLIIERIHKLHPTIIQATPSFYQLLFNAGWQGSGKIKILCGGDLLSETLAQKLIDNSLEAWNMYGPTETTIWSSTKKIGHYNEASNIGKPIYNTKFYILDSFFNLQPVGAVGSLYIGGSGLAKGYYKNAELTNGKFVKNPFNTEELIYETGDLGRWNENGEIEFFGRNDNQVKIRGYRIELGDIEAQLNLIDPIKESVVIAKKNDKHEDFLVAYIIKENSAGKIQIGDIISILSKKLPLYMIPHNIIAIDQFPLTPNQKIDRKALSQKTVEDSVAAENFIAPASDLQKLLSQFWTEVLELNTPLSIQDNFFSLGGNSLNAFKLSAKIESQLLYALPVKLIFKYPTIESLSNYLKDLPIGVAAVLPVSVKKDFYTLTPAQYNIWIASQKRNTSVAYNMFAAYKVNGNIDSQFMAAAVEEIIAKYEILRTNFVEIDGVPFQKINQFEKNRFKISIEESGSDQINDLVYEFNNTFFDLESDLLVRVKIIKINEAKSMLLFCTHHIIVDGLSLEIFISELMKNYNKNFIAKRTVDNYDERLQIQFKDYSEWLNGDDQKLKENNLFWQNYLKDFLPVHTFERDFENVQGLQISKSHCFEFDAAATHLLKQIAKNEKVSFYTLLVTTLNATVYTISGHSDICIGTVSSGRNISLLKDQIGMFVKTLALRTVINPELNFTDILHHTDKNLHVIDEYHSLPFENFSQAIFDSMIIYQDSYSSFEDIKGFHDLDLNRYSTSENPSRIPLVFNFFEIEDSLKLVIEFNSNMYDETSIAIINSKYLKVIETVVKNPLVKMNSIDATIEIEKHTELDFDFNF